MDYFFYVFLQSSRLLHVILHLHYIFVNVVFVPDTREVLHFLGYYVTILTRFFSTLPFFTAI